MSPWSILQNRFFTSLRSVQNDTEGVLRFARDDTLASDASTKDISHQTDKMIKAADEMCPHMIISFDNQKIEKGKGTIQDTLALMSGMVPFRTVVVKDRTKDWRGENKGNTIRVLDRVPGGC